MRSLRDRAGGQYRHQIDVSEVTQDFPLLDSKPDPLR
jgi:hypothetical protein